MLLGVGRHSLAKERRNPTVLLASVLAPAAVFLVVKGDASPLAEAADVEPVVEQAPMAAAEPAAPCCVEIVASPATAPDPALTVVPASASADPVSLVSASRWRVVSRTLPAGVAPERGLQVRTILTSRSISAVFPEISNIGGVRPDSLRWHPNGLALDVMIPNYTSQAGIALGNQIVAFVMANAERFGIQDAIWRGAYYTPGGGVRAGGYGHYDHVHITTTGGGYPSGDELYFR
ncbi:hypothetical protein [Mycolicibacterium pyrenivorans]|uniref:hypothetical protein n=1 Tax=Mycolicibacterium pyrenivorans TaxID=187102 RepID=UPI0023AB4503|nr:hypothetical protein [Mycolicibacterium pyrenivorans]